jgi:hypothetical protein
MANPRAEFFVLREEFADDPLKVEPFQFEFGKPVLQSDRRAPIRRTSFLRNRYVWRMCGCIALWVECTHDLLTIVRKTP